MIELKDNDLEDIYRYPYCTLNTCIIVELPYYCTVVLLTTVVGMKKRSLLIANTEADENTVQYNVYE